MKFMLSVDPGYAVWSDDDKDWASHPPEPLWIGCIRSDLPTRRPWQDRIRTVLESMGHLIEGGHFRPIKRIVVEWPELFNTATGLAGAKRGNITQLAFSCGWIGCLAHRFGAELTLAPIRWKGQLKKDALAKRVMRRLKKDRVLEELEEHEWHAIGLGLWLRGAL
jgi:hypothetical protein